MVEVPGRQEILLAIMHVLPFHLMRLYRSKNPLFPCLVLGAFIAALLYILASNNLDYSGIWFDEAAQFWIAQGLSRFAEPFSDPAGLLQVIKYNNRANLDPGGFSVLLHWWTMPGKSIPMLRTLPFLFLLLAMLSLGLLAWQWARNSLFAMSASALPLCYPGIMYFAFEIRAYSMEMAGLAVCTLLFVRVLDEPSRFHALLLGMAGALFMASRYSFFLFILALGLAYLLSHRITGQPFDKAARQRYAWFALLIIAAGSICVYVTLRNQLWPEMRSSGIGITAPVYTQSSMLRGADGVANLIARNVFSPAALPITVVILWLMLLRRTWCRWLVKSGDPGLIAVVNRRFIPVYLMIVLVQAFSILSSLLGIYPWDITSRWSAYLLMLSAISVLTIGAEMLVHLQAVPVANKERTVLAQPAAVLTTVFMLGVFSLGTANALSHRNSIEGTYITNVAHQLDQLSIDHAPPGSIFVAHHEIPILRYLYEYGPYSGRAEYPGAFRFETNEEFKSQAAIDASAEGLQYIVSAWTPEQLSRRLIGCQTASVNGTRLYSIICSPARSDGGLK